MVQGLGLWVHCFDLRLRSRGTPRTPLRTPVQGGEAGLLIRKHDHFTPTREIRRHVWALARNHPDGCKLQGHVSTAATCAGVINLNCGIESKYAFLANKITTQLLWVLGCVSGFRVSGFRVSGFGVWVHGSGFRGTLGFWVHGFGFRISGFGFWVLGFGFRFSGFGFRVLGCRGSVYIYIYISTEELSLYI